MKVYSRCGHTGILNYLGELKVIGPLGHTFRLCYNDITIEARVENLVTSNAGKWGSNPKLATVTQERVLVFDDKFTAIIKRYLNKLNKGQYPHEQHTKKLQ